MQFPTVGKCHGPILETLANNCQLNRKDLQPDLATTCASSFLPKARHGTDTRPYGRPRPGIGAGSRCAARPLLVIFAPCLRRLLENLVPDDAGLRFAFLRSTGKSIAGLNDCRCDTEDGRHDKSAGMRFDRNRLISPRRSSACRRLASRPTRNSLIQACSSTHSRPAKQAAMRLISTSIGFS